MITSTKGSRLLAGTLAACACGVAGLAWAADEGLFSAEALRFAMPKQHEVGAENYEPDPSRNGSAFHYRGEDCSRCHMEGGKATNYPFTMAGTVYADFDGTQPLEGAEILLEDETGKTISMVSNEEGNFFTQEPLAGMFYKSWVKNEDRVIPMVTVPKVGGVSTWMSCNMHHYPESPRGALFVPTGRTLREYPADNETPDFAQHVLPILLQQCRPCHVPAESSPSTTQMLGDQTLTYDFSGGLDLTSYEGLASAWNEDAALIDTEHPEDSLLLSKTVVDDATEHAGGTYFKPTDPDYQVIQRWIAAGAQP